jgi:hypothetical protein
MIRAHLEQTYWNITIISAADGSLVISREKKVMWEHAAEPVNGS